MTPVDLARSAGHRIVTPSPVELIAHATILLIIIVCTTVLGVSHDLSSGDVLAVFTACISGTAAVAGARAGNRNLRRTDPDTDG